MSLLSRWRAADVPGDADPTAGLRARCLPDFPEAHTFGWDEAGALEAAADCLREALWARARDREAIPAPSPIVSGGHSATAPMPTSLSH